MTDRESELRDLAATLRERDAVADAFLAKSFTDRLLIVDLERGEPLPAAVGDLLEARDLRGANEVYGTDDGDPSLAGDVGDANRHQFVDLRSRGRRRSSVAN